MKLIEIITLVVVIPLIGGIIGWYDEVATTLGGVVVGLIFDGAIGLVYVLFEIFWRDE